MKGGLGDIMKKAQQMQEQMQKAQEEIAATVVEGQSGAGLVKVSMNGRHEITGVTLDDSLMSDGDKEMLEDLLAAAVNDAVRKVDETTQKMMGSVAGGMNLPGGLKFPF